MNLTLGLFSLSYQIKVELVIATKTLSDQLFSGQFQFELDIETKTSFLINSSEIVIAIELLSSFLIDSKVI